MRRSPWQARFRSGLALGITVAAHAAYGQSPSPDCKECHRCLQPTASTPCLLPCPTLSAARQISPHALAEAPDHLILNKLVDQYQGAVFQHKLHAGMAAMTQGCGVCHHFSPPGKIEPCASCHDPQSRNADLRKPGLKGAYHRQCLQCHREWSHETDCNLCHQPQESTATKMVPRSAPDATDIVGRKHPTLAAPTRRVYKTPYTQGPVVTFDHQVHTDLIGLKCVNCHQQENCSSCHDAKLPAAKKKTMAQVHAVCSGCHQANSCNKCHDQQERPGVDQNTTGWPPLRLHAQVGLTLDANHSAFECTDCHPQRRFDKPPSCTTCHDDGRTYQKSPPGKLTPYKTPKHM